MSAGFAREFHVGWGELDSNAHMRNTAYLDVAADTRLMFFREQGFSLADFARLRIGPVMERDEVEYFKELHLLESFRVTLQAAGLSPDGARFRLRNEFWKGGGGEAVLVARVTSSGGWLDLARRRLVAPPPDLAAALASIERSPDFAPLQPLEQRSV
jgi:acyl-CoA thioester hydrolase